ncbi:MAG TPA: MFS transporter [Gaiellaceae bacterium]
MTVPLRRNRDFMLLQAGQTLSAAGSQVASIAYPLLVLAVTHSPSKAGIVGFATLLPGLVVAPLAGVAADHWDRKRLMIGCDAVRAAAMATLAALVFEHAIAFWAIALLAFVDSAFGTLFNIAQTAALRSVVPAAQLPDAAGVVEGRRAAVRLGAPPLGGALFSVARGVPFLVDAVSFAASTAALLAMRSPFQQPRDAEPGGFRRRLAEGFGYLWRQPFLRTTAFVYGLGNILATGIFLILVVTARRQGLSGAQIGLLFTVLGIATLVGSVTSPLHRRFLGVRTILLLELWTWTGAWVFVAWPNVYSLLAVVVPFGLCAPVTDSVVVGYMTAMTPDRLLGRVESARLTIAVAAAPLGPLAAGFLLDSVSERATVAAFAALGLVLALWGTLSPSIRKAPSLDELATLTA